MRSLLPVFLLVALSVWTIWWYWPRLKYYWLRRQIRKLSRSVDKKLEENSRLRRELGMKIGGISAVPSITDWYQSARVKGCPNCGLDFSTQRPESNIYPHWTGACKEPK